MELRSSSSSLSRRLFLSRWLAVWMTTSAFLHVAHASSQKEEESENPSDWYKRYPAYPPYCSTPEEMDQRALPPLQTGVENITLVHVTVAVRHGARTPWAGGMNCWENYSELDTGVWNCHLTTLMAPPSPQRIAKEEERKVVVSSNGQFLFEKQYNALNDPANNLNNELRGTCQLGQLLLRGYEQELANGNHLRQAYMEENSDPRMRLFNNNLTTATLINTDDDDDNVDTSSNGTNTTTRWPWTDLYYRADDDQRTLMSGQVLLRGLFQNELQQYYDHYQQMQNNSNNSSNAVDIPLIPLHTADRDRDVMDANEDVCPRLAQLHQEFLSSPDYQAYLQSQEVQTMKRFLQDILKVEVDEVDPDVWVDCTMTTICTDRTLPDAINDYQGPNGKNDDNPPYGSNLFERLFQYGAYSTIQLFQYNDAAYSKLGLTPIWKDVLANIQGMMQQVKNSQNLTTDNNNNNNITVCCPPRAPPRLAVYSGHDTTLMPMLASLGPAVWDRGWSPYASMMNIELYYQERQQHEQQQDTNSTEDDNFWFRLVYNGKVLTPLVEGCASTTTTGSTSQEDLCPIRVLMERVTNFTKDFNCTPSDGFVTDGGAAATDVTTPTSAGSSFGLSSPGGILALCLLVLGSTLFGSLGTYLYVLDSVRRNGGRQRLNQVDHESNEDGDISMLDHSDGFRGDEIGGVRNGGATLT